MQNNYVQRKIVTKSYKNLTPLLQFACDAIIYTRGKLKIGNYNGGLDDYIDEVNADEKYHIHIHTNATNIQPSRFDTIHNDDLLKWANQYHSNNTLKLNNNNPQLDNFQPIINSIILDDLNHDIKKVSELECFFVNCPLETDIINQNKNKPLDKLIKLVADSFSKTASTQIKKDYVIKYAIKCRVEELKNLLRPKNMKLVSNKKTEEKRGSLSSPKKDNKEDKEDNKIKSSFEKETKSKIEDVKDPELESLCTLLKAKINQKFEVGNCGQHANLAYKYFYKNFYFNNSNDFKIQKCESRKGDHQVLSLLHQDEEMLICDPWAAYIVDCYNNKDAKLNWERLLFNNNQIGETSFVEQYGIASPRGHEGYYEKIKKEIEKKDYNENFQKAKDAQNKNKQIIDKLSPKQYDIFIINGDLNSNSIYEITKIEGSSLPTVEELQAERREFKKLKNIIEEGYESKDDNIKLKFMDAFNKEPTSPPYLYANKILEDKLHKGRVNKIKNRIINDDPHFTNLLKEKLPLCKVESQFSIKHPWSTELINEWFELLTLRVPLWRKDENPIDYLCAFFLSTIQICDKTYLSPSINNFIDNNFKYNMEMTILKFQVCLKNFRNNFEALVISTGSKKWEFSKDFCCSSRCDVLIYIPTIGFKKIIDLDFSAFQRATITNCRDIQTLLNGKMSTENIKFEKLENKYSI